MTYDLGSFTYDVITLGGGGGGFQMMTIDDEGRGGVLTNNDVITGTQFFGKFLRFFKKFSKIFQKINEIWTKIFYFSRKFSLKLMLNYFYGIT